MNKTTTTVEITAKKEILKSRVRFWRNSEKIIGFVPTMGSLHLGHISLVKKAKQECDVVVVSIFVNPLQFNNLNDLEKYPRDLIGDRALLEKEGVDLIFAPENSDFYAIKPILSMDFGPVSKYLEGQKRPGHFSGVGVVVARLFHLVEPHKAYFGAKDLQQLAVVRTMVQDLAFEIEIVGCETLRENSGLAMSSRNSLLSENGKNAASVLFRALRIGIQLAHKNSLEMGIKNALQIIELQPELKLEYLNWVDTSTMEIIETRENQKEIALCVAAWVEGVRLIDNMIM